MKKAYITIIVILVAIIAFLAVLLVQATHPRVAVAPTTTQSVAQTTDTDGNPVPTSIPHTTIISPVGKQTLVVGQSYTLKWTGGDDPTEIFLIDVALKPVGASVSSVDRVYDIQNTGSYTYTIPTYIKPGTYQFTIGDATSDEFQIKS